MLQRCQTKQEVSLEIRMKLGTFETIWAEWQRLKSDQTILNTSEEQQEGNRKAAESGLFLSSLNSK